VNEIMGFGLRSFGKLVFLFAVLLAACGDSSGPSASEHSVLIEGVPHVRQKPDFCGEACVEMYLRKLGENMDQDYVFDRAGVDPTLGRGLIAAELDTALRKIGFETGDVWTPVDHPDRPWRELAAMIEDLRRGVPSIVCMHYSDAVDATEHFRLILGYDADANELIYHEPAEDDGAYRRMARDLFLEIWPIGPVDEQVIVRMRLEQEALEYGEASTELTDADYAQFVMKLRRDISSDFTIVAVRPFVVIGNEPYADVEFRSRVTVKWAIDQLKRLYFTRDPDRIVTIWIFSDGYSYTRYTRLLLDEDPISPFGFYAPAAEMMLMNIAWGNGTLVHEIVHPFMERNFPECPPWFNEGLGSLYETTIERDGRIWGRTNWRLIGLKEAIRSGTPVRFEELFAMDEDEFYGDLSGNNYAQARFLLQFLQETGRLVDFYHAFHQGYFDDPTGIEALCSVLGEDDLVAFQEYWERWVMGLGFE
jgi:hypothetical protein